MKPALEKEAKERKKQSQFTVGVERHPPAGDKSEGRTTEIAGKMLGIGTSTLNRGDRIARERPDLYEKIKKGEHTINSAYNQLDGVSKKQKIPGGAAPKIDGRKKERNYEPSIDDALEQILGNLEGQMPAQGGSNEPTLGGLWSNDHRLERLLE